jgi:hypothetical protein
MAVVGHSAASRNVFLDIPIFLRGLSQSICYHEGPKISISKKFLGEIKTFDPSDPTQIYDEYLVDWWNFDKEWKTHSEVVDLRKAFNWHVEKVRENIYTRSQC